MPKRRKKRNIHITDHAIVQYLSRIEGMDIEALRTRILDEDNERVMKPIEYLKEGLFPVHPSHRVRIKNKNIVTVLPYDN